MRTTTTAFADTVTVQVVDDPDVGADVYDSQSEVRIQFHVHGGHVVPSARADLVEAVLDLPDVRRHRKVLVSIPIGDAELIDALRHHCVTMQTRAAGSTCLIDAEL